LNLLADTQEDSYLNHTEKCWSFRNPYSVNTWSILWKVFQVLCRHCESIV